MKIYKIVEYGQTAPNRSVTVRRLSASVTAGTLCETPIDMVGKI
jgi:hypothetical protein